MIRKSILLNKDFIGAGIAVIGIVIAFYFANQEPKFTFNQNYFEIGGSFGRKISYNEILSVDTISFMPKIGNKIRGSDTWKTKKGKFNLKNIGEANLFIKVHAKLFILLKKNNGEIFYLNTKNRKSTLKLFNNLKKCLEE
jgi:hypothetical protein